MANENEIIVRGEIVCETEWEDADGNRHGKAGRPTIMLDQIAFEELLEALCTQQEIANYFGVGVSTINAWCRRIYAKTFMAVAASFRAKGITELRKSGVRLAQNNPAVHIFYAKNYLGMSDEPRAIDTGEHSKSFASAMKESAKHLEKLSSLDDLVEIPGVQDRGGQDGDK